jgi:hypothetical protein
MTAFFEPNIGAKGRVARALGAVLLLAAAFYIRESHGWLALALACGGGLCAFQALRGWCLLRACGFRTPI